MEKRCRHRLPVPPVLASTLAKLRGIGRGKDSFTLSGRTFRLRVEVKGTGMRVAATLERGAAADRRRFMRHPVSVGAGLASANDRPGAPVIVVDLSTHGCGLEVAGHCEVGARVWLKLPGLESWPSRIAWAQGDRAGLSFDRPLHQAVVDRYA
jgi:hypothetical protein